MGNDTPQWGQSEPDPFEETAQQELDLPERFVSTRTVDVGEGLRVEVRSFDIVTFPGDKDEPDRKLGQIVAEVLESRADKFRDGQECVITCGPESLETLANLGPGPGDIVTLVRGPDVGRKAGWRHKLERVS